MHFMASSIEQHLELGLSTSDLLGDSGNIGETILRDLNKNIKNISSLISKPHPTYL